jgi:hypothetical protein
MIKERYKNRVEELASPSSDFNRVLIEQQDFDRCDAKIRPTGYL